MEEERFAMIEAMNKLMVLQNDEEAYREWIAIVPDEADDADLAYIAKDDQLLYDAAKAFCRIISRYTRHGGFFADGQVFGV